MDTNTQGTNGDFVNIATRVLAVLGFVAIIGIGMWGGIKVASGVPGAFSSLASAFVGLTQIFVPAGETITLSAPSFTVNAGTPFTLSWVHNKKSVEGSYTFRYDCAEGVYFTSPTPSGADATVYCNVPFNFFNANNGISLTPFSTTNKIIDVTVYIDFTPNGASKATVTGTAVLTVENGLTATAIPATTTSVSHPITQLPSQPVTPAVTPGPTQTQTFPINGTSGVQTSNPNGRVDLTAHVIEVGFVNKSTGAFTASSTPSRSFTSNTGLRIAVRFAVENIGTKTSPQFDFAAVLPTMPPFIFNSPMQQELAPGDRIEFTLAFDSVNQSGTGTFTVNVDPSGRINESNKDNNIVHYTVTTTP